MSTTIPKSDMVKAMRALMVNQPDMVESVARALMAEREACAMVADAHSECERDCGDVIASAIRDRTKL